MIRLTLRQIHMAESAAAELHEVERIKDCLPQLDELTAVLVATREHPLGVAGGAAVRLNVSRDTVIASLNERRKVARDTLEALGIDFDPAG